MGIILFFLKRIAQAIPIMFLISLITFVLIQAPPGDYGTFIETQAISSGATLDDAKRQADSYRERYGLDKPVLQQYAIWMKNIITKGDFGQSFVYNKPVAEVVKERLPITLAIALTCHLLASILGISLGVIAAVKQYSWIDYFLSFIAFIGMTVPRFLLAIIILYLLVFKFHVSEFGSFFSPEMGIAPWSWAKFVDLIQHIWPVIAVATFGGLAYNMRIMRSNLLDVLHAQYIETARAKGISETRVISRHALPNALHPLIMYQGVVLPYMLTGEIEVAVVFTLATVGPAIVNSMTVGDIYVTSVFTMLLAFTLIIGNIIADLLLAALDPRIRIGGEVKC